MPAVPSTSRPSSAAPNGAALPPVPAQARPGLTARRLPRAATPRPSIPVLWEIRAGGLAGQDHLTTRTRVTPLSQTTAGARGVFEGLDDWEVGAAREGKLQTAGFFRQTYPQDAVLLLVAIVRTKFAVPTAGWDGWTFWCVARDGAGRPRRTLVFEISPTGQPVLLADSKAGGFPQGPAGAEG